MGISPASPSTDRYHNERRNLLVSSFGLIVLLLSNGKFNEGGTLFGGSISIQHIIVLDVAIWIVHSYIIWRFWLLTKDAPAGRFIDSLNESLASYEGFKSIVYEVIRQNSNDSDARTYPNRLKYIRRLPFVRKIHSGRDGLLKLPFFKTVYYEIKALTKIVLTQPNFSDTELPYILAAAPFYILFFKFIF